MGHSLPAITKLLNLLNSGEVYFEVLEEEELQLLIEEEEEKIASGEVVVTVRKTRKDAGTGQRGVGRKRQEDSGSDSDGPPSKKARTSHGTKSTALNKKTPHRSASQVVDSD